jgi:hypothetical protein
MKARGHWLTSADRFLVEIAAARMARYRLDELKSRRRFIVDRVAGQDRIFSG